MKTMNDVQAQVQKTIDGLVDSGTERGLQVAAYKGGKLVVDAVAGVADPATGRKVDSGTPFYCYSVVKAAASTITHILVERGLFGYDTPVVELWPEFGAHGKEKVTVRNVLSHTAGVPGIPLTTTIEDLCDWDKMCAAIADEELWWEPGAKIGYHAYTFGYIVGEIVRRATSKPISQLLVEEVSGPLGVEKELYFGMPRSEHMRLAVLEDYRFAAARPLLSSSAGASGINPDATAGEAQRLRLVGAAGRSAVLRHLDVEPNRRFPCAGDRPA